MFPAARGIAAALLVALLILSPASALAQTPPPDQPTPIPLERLGDSVPWPAGDLTGGRGPLSHGLTAVSDPLVSVIVEFEGPALAERVVERGRMSTLDQRNYTAALRSRQAEVVSRVQQAGGAVIGQFTKAYNGVQVQVPASELAELRKASGVKAIHPVRTYYPALDHSTEIIRADAVWKDTGYTGEGVTIAVIDTGIDYTHAAFGGPGTAAAYMNNKKNIIEPGTFPTAKVIGGYDFAGTYYTGANSPTPDPDPLDEQDHGTHVASTAAGLAVGASLAQGVAPGAKLYALKVFGASGGTQLVMPALEWCMDPNGDGNTDDHVDVVNLSLGSDFGVADPNDPEIVALEQLAALGTVIVAASGNSYNTEYITGSPAVADSAISVAATSANDADDDQMTDFSSRGPRGYDSALKPEISAPGTMIYAAYRGTGEGGVNMQGTSMATPHVAGVAALVRQAHPEWTAEQVKAAIMNTAVDVGHEIPRMGAGRVDALRAVTTETVAVGDPKLVSLSWGVVEFIEAIYTTTKQVMVHNVSDVEKIYAVSGVWGYGSNQTGAVITPEPSVTVPANGSKPFTVELQLNAEEINDWVTTSPGLEEYYGFVRLENQSDAGDVLVVPFYFLPTPYTTITVDSFGFDSTSVSGVFDHNGPIASDVSAHTVYVHDANDPTIRDDADLRLVTMDTYTDGFGFDWIVFGFNMYGAFHNPQVYFVEVYLYLDVDRDGVEDYAIFNFNYGRANTDDKDNTDTNEWILVMEDLETGEFYEGGYIYTDFNSGTMFWELPAFWYELGPWNSTFGFQAVSFDSDWFLDLEYDATPVRTVDYLDPPLSFATQAWTLNGDQDVPIQITRNESISTPVGVALFDSRGKAGEGQATFRPFDGEFITLSYDAFPTGGQITGHPAGMYLPDSRIILKAVPRGDYYFVQWYVNGKIYTSNQILFQLEEDTTVAAEFAPLKKAYLPLILR